MADRPAADQEFIQGFCGSGREQITTEVTVSFKLTVTFFFTISPFPLIIPYMSQQSQPIGVFDSGVGGLSVLRAMRQLMPEEPAIYFGDQGHVPYGPRSLQQVRDFSEAITRFLLKHDAKLIVVACNTASAAALHYLRNRFPAVLFVGMEPAVKPAAEHTQSGLVGVLATPATFQGALYASVLERFANGVQILQHTCPGLVGQIERGDLDGKETRAILENALRPMLDRGIDTVVLGCTHYPFVIPLIEQIAGDKVRVIDPAPAVAKQAQRLLVANGMKNSVGEFVQVKFYTSGDADLLVSILPKLLGGSGPVTPVTWLDDRHVELN
jgi:glutamate racemase